MGKKKLLGFTQKIKILMNKMLFHIVSHMIFWNLERLSWQNFFFFFSFFFFPTSQS